MKQKKQYRIKLYIVLVLFLLFSHYVSAAEVFTLEKALEIGMLNSPDIKQTELGLEQSTEYLNARKASLKSNFSLMLNPFSYTRDRTFDDLQSIWYTGDTKTSSTRFTISQPIEQTDGTISINNMFSWRDSYSEYRGVRTKSYNNSLNIQFRQPIFTYNRTKMELSELELDIVNAQYNYAIQKLALEQSVTQSFYDVYQTRINLDIALKELENRKQSYEIIKNKVKAGLSAEEELYQSELDLANSNLSVQNTRETLENSLDSFKLLLGISIYEDIDVETDITHKVVEVNLDNALNNGLKSRMELRQREISIETARNNLIRTAAQNEFSGNVVLSYGVTGTDEKIENIFDSATRTQEVGLTFNIPLWDWGEQKSRIRASEVNIERQNLSFEDERNNIILAIRRSYRNLEKLVTQIDIARQNVRNAQLTYNINLERYKNGDLTSMDLNLYQNQLSAANQGEVQALINYKLALLSMKILSLWDFEKNEPVLPETIIE